LYTQNALRAGHVLDVTGVFAFVPNRIASLKMRCTRASEILLVPADADYGLATHGCYLDATGMGGCT
ncbi:MAG: hypothetical protein AAGJ70_13685, partial [Pseudomonadota bacterium]